MDVIDQDMQMIRDFLLQWGAPEYIKGHFENLVSEYAKDAARVEALEAENRSLREEESARYQKLDEEFDDYKREAKEEADARVVGALETVKYWLLDVLVHKRPMQMPPRQILRIVEEAL